MMRISTFTLAALLVATTSAADAASGQRIKETTSTDE